MSKDFVVEIYAAFGFFKNHFFIIPIKVIIPLERKVLLKVKEKKS